MSVRHSVVDATTRISSEGTSRHHSASAVSGSLYGSGGAFPRKARDHLSPSVPFMTSLFLYLSKDGVGEKAAQGVRSTTARKGVESAGRGGILGCGCKMCERMPRVRCPPVAEIQRCLSFIEYLRLSHDLPAESPASMIFDGFRCRMVTRCRTISTPCVSCRGYVA